MTSKPITPFVAPPLPEFLEDAHCRPCYEAEERLERAVAFTTTIGAFGACQECRDGLELMVPRRWIRPDKVARGREVARALEAGEDLPVGVLEVVADRVLEETRAPKWPGPLVSNARLRNQVGFLVEGLGSRKAAARAIISPAAGLGHCDPSTIGDIIRGDVGETARQGFADATRAAVEALVAERVLEFRIELRCAAGLE